MKLVLTACLSLLFFLSVPAFAASTICEEDVIQEGVDILYGKLDTFPEGQAALRQVDLAVQNGHIAAADKERAVKVNLEIAYRNKNACGVPEGLRNEAAAFYSFADSGTVECEQDQYLAEAETIYTDMRESPAFAGFEQQVKQQITANVVPELKGALEQKWDNEPGFRRNVIVAAVQIIKRQENNCKNSALPVADLMRSSGF